MKKMMTGNRKYKRRRIAAAAGAGLTAAAVLITAVLGRPIDSEAADTLIGVEKLRSEVKASGRDYTILEIVPDKDAAEIGYFFDGYEPILGEWVENEDEGTYEWLSWKDLLIKEDYNNRAGFIQGKKKALEKYYDQVGFKEGDALPVTISGEDYAEQDEPGEGFEKITAGGEEARGWFTYSGNWSGEYNLRFEQAIYTGDIIGADFEPFGEGVTLYYKAVNPISVQKWMEDNNKTVDDLYAIDGDIYVYRKSTALGVDSFYSPANGKTLGALRPTVRAVMNGMGEGGIVVPNDGSGTDKSDDESDDTEDEEGGDDGDDENDGSTGNTGDGNTGNTGDENGGSTGNTGDENGGSTGNTGDENGGNNGNTGDGSNGVKAITGNISSLSANMSQGKWFKLVGEDGDVDSDEEEDEENEDWEGDEKGEENIPGDDSTQDPNLGDGYADDMDSDEGFEDETPDDEKAGSEEEDGLISVYDDSSDLTWNDVYFVQFVKLSVTEYQDIANNALEDPICLYEVVQDDIVRSSNRKGEYSFGKYDAEKTSGQTYMNYKLPGSTIYCKGTFTNNEWFKKYVINLDKGDYKDFNVKVLVYTPEELNAMAELPKFDFLYLNSGLRKAAVDGNGDESIGGNGDDGNNTNHNIGNYNTGNNGDYNTGNNGDYNTGNNGDYNTGNNDDYNTGDNDDYNTDADAVAKATVSLSSNVSQGKWVKLAKNDEEDTDTETEGVVYGEGNDLNDKSARALYDTVLGKRIPCLVDGSILYAQGEGIDEKNPGGIVTNDDYKDTQIFKLSAMLCQEDFGSGNYGSLAPDKMMNGIVDDADKNFVVEHVYCRYGDGKDSIINNLFNVATIYEEGGEMSPGFQNVLDEILLENQYREADSSGNYKKLSTDITQAKAVRHIINYANRRKVETKKHIRVLEIQPAKADKAELTLEQLQKWAPGVESADITVMTTAEFIGKIEKLNENYDLIYIGTSKDHLNMRYWVGDKDYNSKGKPDADHVPAGTAFNDEDMDGLIYYNIGDLRAVSMSLGGQLDTEYWGERDPENKVYNNNLYYYNYVRYPGNDITKEKKEALLSFLDGSYPIVVADDFFESPVTVYNKADYAGARVNLAEGEYDYNAMAAEGIPGANIDSVKVKEGYKVTIYNGWFFEDNAAGNRYYISFDKDESDFSKLTFPGWDSRDPSWNKKANSIKVERISEDVPPRTIDEDHIDNCTYMYEFVKKAMEEKYVNFYAWSDITEGSELFKFYLNRPKVSLADVTVNGLMKEGSDIYYVEAGINDKYNLQYSFTIHNEGAASYSTRYQCKLYIDINSDGKFSEQEEIPDVSLTQGGGNVSANDLYADRQYVLVREVPAGYKGLLPWKVEITQVDNPNIYTSVTGYSKLEGMEKEQIKVVQICRDLITDVNWTGGEDEELFDLGTEIGEEGVDNGTIYHTLVYGGDIDSVHYDGISKDYDINVTFLTISDFEKRYYGGTYKEKDEDEESYHDPNPNYLDDFNMLILGFSDIYGDFSGDSKSGPMGAIVDFVNSGKSVLFAHDTTSFFNYPKAVESGFRDRNGTGYPYRNDANTKVSHGDYNNAYSLNHYIRNLVGMDRYGILDSDILPKGQTLYEGSGEYDSVVSSGYEVAYKPKSGKRQTVPEVHGYTYLSVSSKDYSHLDTDDKEEFYWWNLDTSQTAQEIRPNETNEKDDGPVFHNYYTNIRYDMIYYKDNVTEASVGRRNGEVPNPRNGETDFLYVTQVNQGQITEYPYKLKENFEVAETHGQYYQLDYMADADGDGESDLVVWYCLGNRNGNQETIYSQSPNDVRNNYYIYNKGNVTYTGMGHSTMRERKYTVEEAKLFINTIIAAYQAGIKDPYITLLKKGVPESDELKMMYRYYDMKGATVSLDDEAATEDYEKVYFTVQDVNFIKGTRKITAHAFYEADDGSETITVGGKDIAVNRLADAMFKASDDSPVAANNLLSGGIYYILVPRSVLNKCDKENGLDIYFEAQTILTTNTTKANVYETDKVYAKLKVLQAYMFNLD